MLVNFVSTYCKRDLSVVTVKSTTYLAAFLARHMTLWKEIKNFVPYHMIVLKRSLTIKRFGVSVYRGSCVVCFNFVFCT